MGNFKYFIRLSLAYLTRFKGVFILGVISGVVIFTLISVFSPVIFRGQTQKIGITGRYHTNELPDSLLELFGRGLTKITESGYVEPDLAYSWETPDKGKTWVFKLQNDIIWQDKDKLTSDTVSYEFSDVTIERPDAETLVFKLEDPFAPFPSVVSKPTFKKGLLGVGEWKVEKIILAGTYVHEITAVNSTKDKKIFKFYPTLDRTKLAYKLGEIDIISETLDSSPFTNWKNTTVVNTPYRNHVVVLFFNTKDPTLSEKSLRQALTYSINKSYFGERAISPISPDSWAFNPQVKEYEYDPERAKLLIDELDDEVKSNLSIKLVSSPVLLETAETISNDWKGIGIDTVVQVSSVVPTDFQAYLTILDIPKDPDQYPLWHSTQENTNISKYSDPRIDKLLEDGRSELDIEERRKIYLDFQRFLLEDLPAAFLYHPNYYTITRK
ncbi:hypothetical protein A2714_00950 [Candidatus Woesebacteria bacterium RIFCSPHIGHO2_01_FULL_38_9]|uniref:Solute-binding protein family 5 domain-containing protein n=2 Tax=Candidatus Woeseibacteriota TaxID=1752722 RepID=A0A1F7XYH9_9BACT|nr:MAG: hypothetical protein A2714_00950 [Candidatus Woesebacteria bacterium RIFCSPHIGHO2_01_FULL_38_9]OGM59573.1 MAG: hypothetical protein A3A75_06035 [Candidatus Woesebacteria bacterium RIFCSPLOWO2_01_FULL_39_10]